MHYHIMNLINSSEVQWMYKEELPSVSAYPTPRVATLGPPKESHLTATQNYRDEGSGELFNYEKHDRAIKRALGSGLLHTGELPSIGLCIYMIERDTACLGKRNCIISRQSTYAP